MFGNRGLSGFIAEIVFTRFRTICVEFQVYLKQNFNEKSFQMDSKRLLQTSTNFSLYLEKLWINQWINKRNFQVIFPLFQLLFEKFLTNFQYLLHQCHKVISQNERQTMTLNMRCNIHFAPPSVRVITFNQAASTHTLQAIIQYSRKNFTAHDAFVLPFGGMVKLLSF